MNTSEMQMTHYGRWKKWMRDAGFQDLYLESLKAMKEFSYEKAIECPFMRKMIEGSSTEGLDVADKELLDRVTSEINRRGEQNAASLTFREVLAIMAFDYYGKALLEISPGLAEGLLETELNIPVKEILVPRPSFYVPMPGGVDFSIDTRSGLRRVLGVYVLYQTELPYPRVTRVKEEDTSLMFFAVARDGLGEGYPDFSYYFWNINFPKEGEELAENRISRLIKEWKGGPLGELIQKEATEGITRLVVNAFLYMNQPSSEQDTKFTPHPRMEAVRANTRLSKTEQSSIWENYWSSINFELFETGHTISVRGLKGTPRSGVKGPHESPVGHIRRGHWHEVLHGTGRKLRKRLWYRPIRVTGRAGPVGATYRLD